MLEALRNKIAAGAYGPQKSQKTVMPLLANTTPLPSSSPLILQSQRLLDKSTGPSTTKLQDFGVLVRYISEAEQAARVMCSLAGKRAGLDIETAKDTSFMNNPQAGLEPHLSRIRLVQLYGGGDEVFVIDVNSTGVGCLAGLKDIKLCAHNAMFEMKHLHHARVDLPHIDCTMLQHNALENNRPSLADLSISYLGCPLDKGNQTSDWGAAELSRAQLEYAALDALLAFRLFGRFDSEILERNRKRLYSLLQQAQFPIALMVYEGVKLNTTQHKTLFEEVKRELALAKEEVSVAFGEKFNPNSAQQVEEWLRNNLDPSELKTWPQTQANRLKTDHSALSRIPQNPSLGLLLKYKKYQKLSSAFGTNLLAHCNPRTGRIHPDFMIGGAVTGRMSCSKPNLQNLPRNAEFRSLFDAPEGRLIVCADYSQMETRVAAELSRDTKMCEIYSNGDDLHTRTAMAITGKPREAITKPERQAAKAANFGLLFGQGVNGFRIYAQNSYGVGLSFEEAKRMRNSFLQEYSTLHAWQQASIAEASRTRVCRTVTGRHRALTDKDYYTGSLNFPVQGAAAEVLYSTLGRLPQALSGLDAKIVNCVHDEILLEASAAHASAAKEALETAMTLGFRAIFPEAPTSGLVDARVASNWAEAK